MSEPFLKKQGLRLTEQIDEMQRSIEQLWQQSLSYQAAIDTFKGITNEEVSTDAILSMIKNLNVHFSPIDRDNRDHDTRYYTRRQTLALIIEKALELIQSEVPPIIDEKLLGFNDLDFPIIIRTTGVGTPKLMPTQGNLTSPQWSVSDFAICERQELPHSAKLGTGTNQWHLHIETAGSDTSDRYIAFEIEWNYAQAGQLYGVPQTITSGDLLIPANTPVNTHIAFNIGVPFSFVGQTNVSLHIKPRLKRVVSSGTAPTADPFCEMLQIHYQKDDNGSSEILNK